MEYTTHNPDFLTVTCLEWKPLLQTNVHKDIIIESLRFLNQDKRAATYAFVIMENHFHLIWQILGDHKREDVQRDFLKFTGQQILKELRNIHSEWLKEIQVNAKDRKYQVWERNSLSIELTAPKYARQKLDYIHNNPVKAGLCQAPENYRYSSAGFYLLNTKEWDFLRNYET